MPRPAPPLATLLAAALAACVHIDTSLHYDADGNVAETVAVTPAGADPGAPQLPCERLQGVLDAFPGALETAGRRCILRFPPRPAAGPSFAWRPEPAPGGGLVVAPAPPAALDLSGGADAFIDRQARQPDLACAPILLLPAALYGTDRDPALLYRRCTRNLRDAVAGNPAAARYAAAATQSALDAATVSIAVTRDPGAPGIEPCPGLAGGAWSGSARDLIDSIDRGRICWRVLAAPGDGAR